MELIRDILKSLLTIGLAFIALGTFALLFNPKAGVGIIVSGCGVLLVTLVIIGIDSIWND